MSRSVHNHTQLIFKYYLKTVSQNFHPHPQKSATKSFSCHSKRFVPGRPWTPLDAPVSKYYFFKCSQNCHPPPKKYCKIIFKSFQAIFLWTPLYAPVSKRVLLDEPGRRGVSPPLYPSRTRTCCVPYFKLNSNIIYSHSLC